MAKSYTTDKAKATRLKRWSAALFVFSALQLAIQIAVFVKFQSLYDGTDQSSWVLAYNGMTIASGAFNLICSVLMLCCIASSLSSDRDSSSRCLIFFLLTIALLSAIASVAVSAIEIDRIRHSANHPCQLSQDGSQLQCDLWFDLEIAVADAAGISALITFVIIVVAAKKSKIQPPTPSTPKAERNPQQQQVLGEVTVQQVAAEVTEEPVSTPKELEVEQPNPSPAEVVSNKPSVELSDEMIAYAQELRKMTREELEREMARQFQIKFLRELRVEIDRRNLFSVDQPPEVSASSPRASKQWEHVRHHQHRRSDASSVASSKRTSSPRPPPIELPSYRSSSPSRLPPTPDYDLNDG